MAHLRIVGIPADTGISVFGMSDTQWTVNNDATHEYYSGTPESDEFWVEIKPEAARVLIRVAHMDLKWRADKRMLNPDTQTYEDAWAADVAGDLEFNVGDHLEADTATSKRKVRPLAVTVEDLSKYEPLDFQTSLHTTMPPASKSPNRLPDERRNIYAITPSAARQDIDHFLHSLPREIMWLLYGPLPFTGAKLELTFIFYEFGKDEPDLDSETLARQPWRVDSKNQGVLEHHRQRFLQKVKEWGGTSLFLTVREMRNISPRTFQEDHPLTLPEVWHAGNAAPLWRYMDFAKFVSLVQTQSLWFARPSTFDDPFESKTNRSSRLKHVLRWMNRIITDYNSAVYDEDLEFIGTHSWWAREIVGDDGKIPPLNYESIDDVPPRLRLYCERGLDAALDVMLINCWHQNENESDVMWRAYTDSGNGVAITTSFETLRTCFKTAGAPPKVLSVEYHDLHDESIVFDHLPSAYKHVAFTAEQEVRAYFPTGDLSENAPGQPMTVDLVELIERVTAAPNAPGWFLESVQWVLNQGGIDMEVQRSVFSKKLY